MIEIKNLGEVVDALDKWIADVETLATRLAKGLSVSIFEDVIFNSVQYSGDFAANWKYQINSVDTSYETDILKQEEAVYSFGKESAGTAGQFKAKVYNGGYDERAPQYAARKNRGRDSGFKLGDTIYISNSSTHDIPYAVAIENNSIHLRAGESSARPLEKAVLKVLGGTFQVVGKDNIKKLTSVTQIDTLRRRRTFE